MGDAHMSRCSVREELRSRRQVGSQRELGVSEHTGANSAKRMLCQLSYNHTQLGALGVCTHHRQDFLKTPTHSLDYWKPHAPKFPATSCSQGSSTLPSFLLFPPLPSLLSSHIKYLLSPSHIPDRSGIGNLVVNKTVILLTPRSSHARGEETQEKKSYLDFYCQNLFDVFFGHQATPDQGASMETEVA